MSAQSRTAGVIKFIPVNKKKKKSAESRKHIALPAEAIKQGVCGRVILIQLFLEVNMKRMQNPFLLDLLHQLTYGIQELGWCLPEVFATEHL